MNTPKRGEGRLRQVHSYLPRVEDVPQPQLLVIDEGILPEVTEGLMIVRERFFVPTMQRQQEKPRLKKLKSNKEVQKSS